MFIKPQGLPWRRDVSMGHPKKEVQASQELLLTRHPVTQTLQKSLADWGGSP